MVKIKPTLDDLQARYENEPSELIKEQKLLFKKEGYSSLKALLPLLVQIPLIIGVISVVNNPARHLGDSVDPNFFGMDLFTLPENLFVPALAVLSTIFLCLMQNIFNVISREQGFFGKWGVMIFLVVFTGWFVFVVPEGVGLYWTYSNITGVLVLLICNAIYNPKKYIDYENRSVKIKPAKAEKAIIRQRRKLEKAREKEDMQRFFSVDKELVFFSEASGFYKYFQHFIDYIIENSDITVHYLTADINDRVFMLEKPQFETYFCSDHGLITTFMKMDSEIVVKTLADLGVYHYKRSIVRKDIEYIYIDHGLGSLNLTLRKGALDHYDTIFCYCKDYNEEIRATERVYGLPEKNLVNVGFGLLDMLIENYNSTKRPDNSKPQILIAPSWQKDNILEYCLDNKNCLALLLDGLFAIEADIIIRPHPEFIKRFPGKMRAVNEKYNEEINMGKLEIQTDFSSNSTVYNSDLVITDWSSIALEFSLTTKKPSLFINTPMKVMNPQWREIDVEPMDLWLRERIGVSLDTNQLAETKTVVQDLLSRRDDYKSAIEAFMAENLYNIGNTAEVGGGYIIKQITERRKGRDE
jgi:YidC/Oxa1 family membrane protein insertase